jgi:hypothetical protein
MGDGVLVYFGNPQAHEEDAERAPRAGLSACLECRVSEEHLCTRLTPRSVNGVGRRAKELRSDSGQKCPKRLRLPPGKKFGPGRANFGSRRFIRSARH